ncbi:integral membrane protein S linking to the trans Golgi network-domain-containing protein [Leptodontidium sp. 2 PMI_412]|nr:integral membrane protein S linking to the trans Golgi network-domain-containing protein [Leptodontidium sp. 2 PMI_412]
MARRRRPPRPGALTELPPLKILSQILLLQTLWYVAGTVLILFTALVAGKHFNLDLVLSWRSLRGDTTVGWMLGLVWLLNSLIGVIGILVLISRSKLVPDFAVTLHFIHLLIVSFYSHSIPQNALWWLLQISSTAMMTALGVWACQWRELRPITFGGSAAQTATNDLPTTGEGAGDEEMGYGRGRGRGRGRDGAGEYEMVGMKGEVGEAS